MRAESGNLAAVEHEDLIGITDGADALGDDDLCRAGKLLRKSLAERRVGLIVQRGERIVENQNFRRSCQRPRDGKPLLLPAGDVPAKLGDGMCGLFRVFVHEFRSLRQGKRGLQRRVRLLGFALAEEDVVLDRAGEQNGLLRHIAELVVKRVERILAHVQPVYKDSASRRVVKARNEGGQRRLAAAGRADDGQRLALFYLEADMLQLIRSRARIAEGDIAELDRAGPAALCLRAGDDVRLCVQHLVDALCRDLRLRHEHEDHHEHHKGHHNIGRVGAEHQHVCEHRQPCGGICQRDRLNQRRADPVDGERQPVHAEAEHRLEQGEQPLVFQLQVHHLAAGAVEFPVLIVLRAEGMDDVDAGQIFARHAVDFIRHFLHKTETGNA